MRRPLPLLLAVIGFLALSAPAGASAPARKHAIAEAFLTLDPFMVSVIDNYRVKGFLVIEIALHVPDSHQHHTASERKVHLRDAYTRFLMEYGAKVATVDRPIDVASIATRLQGETDTLLGTGSARVLVTQAMIRKF